MSIILEALGVGEQFCECLMPHVKHHCSYVCRYNANIDDLKSKIEELKQKESDLQSLVDDAKRNSQGIKREVEKWLEDVEKIKTEANGFLEEVNEAQTQCIPWLCPNLKIRYILGKKAKKITGLVLQLQARGEFESVSLPRGPANVVFPTTREEFASRTSIEKEVMDALKDDNAEIIGIYGMGGVGKTTMAERIGGRVKEASIFPNVVMAVVSREPDVKKIQSEIAAQLGLQLTEESSLARPSQLTERLMNEKKILIILDDLWKMLDLQELGIPTGSTHRGCKILITTRDKEVCNQMNASEKTFMVSPLSQEEALSLFKEKSDHSVDFSDIAMQIAKECKGLPIALVTVGRALKGKSLPYWRNTLSELKRALPKNIPGMIEDVYRTLKLSYTNLESEESQSLFLICCLYPEDFKIPIEDLIRNGMGLQVLEDIEDLEAARDRVHVLVGTLKDRCLLIEADKGRAVMMHDVIRDVALHIASKEEHTHMICPNVKEWITKSGDEKCTCVSVISKETVELPTGLNYPNLELLQLRWNNYGSQEAPDDFFKGMRKIKVIDVWSMHIFSLPSSLQFLTNLHTMQLRNMSDFGNVSVIGKLVNLEILSFRYSSITELPEEFGALTNLRFLDLHKCFYLRKIAPGVIQKLVRLEELYLFSFKNWEAERDGEHRKNASLAELKALTNLTTLEIKIPYPGLIPEYMWSSMNLKRFSLCIYYEAKGEWNMFDGIGKFQKEIQLSLPIISPLEEGMKMMLKSTETLYLQDNGAENVMIELVREGFQHVKRLYIQKCDLGKTESFQHLKGSPTVGVFPVLEVLYLESLGGLKEIWNDQLPEGSFRVLRVVYVIDCNNLEKFFSLSTGEALPLLEELWILNCKLLKEVFSVECRQNEGTSNKICFSKLRILRLENLPSLTIFCNGIRSIEFPRLTKLTIDEIGSAFLLNQTVSFPRLKILDLDNVSYVEKIWSIEIQSGSFRGLEKMVVKSCNNLKSLCPVHVARNLIYLKELEIIDCEMMIGIIYEEEEGEQGEETIMEFPSMTELIIKDCPNMKEFSKVSFPRLKTLNLDNVSFVEKIWSIEIQSGSSRGLEKMVVRSCNNLKSLCHVRAARNLIDLNELEIINCEMMIEIISKEEEEEEQGYETIMEFTSMTRLIIKDCPNMKEFSKVSFVRLKTLELKALNSMDKIWCRKIQDSSFKELEVLVVESCDNLRSLFSCSVAKCLVNLKKLEIKNCKLMTEIIEKEEEEYVKGEENLNVSFFPQLESLKLEDLDDLRTFCHMKDFSLGEACTPKRNYIKKDKGSPIETNVNDTIHHPFNEYVGMMNENVGTSNTPLFSKVSFARLESLVLVGLNSVEDIWCSKIEDESFRELEVLRVKSCNNLRSLFLPYVAKSLINLKELQIRDCKMVTEVITKDNEEEKKGEEKLNASLFPKLKSLLLQHLDELKMFCHMKHAVELPSLDWLGIDYCSKMETFSLGAISTPKLECIGRDNIDIETTDVNDTIQHLFNEQTMTNETTENFEQEESA